MVKYLACCISCLILLVLLISIAGWAANAKKPHHPAPPAAVSPSERLGAADSWTAFDFREKSGKVCYVAGEPQKSEPPGARRKPPVAMVTHRPGEKVADVVSFDEGYPLKDGSDVSLGIEGTKFQLFTKGGTAWARTPELDKAIVEAMAKGRQAVVRGTSQKGGATTDTYSLTGFAEALAMIDKACEIKR
jgi:Invasion associated locus B (IalB) protein